MKREILLILTALLLLLSVGCTQTPTGGATDERPNQIAESTDSSTHNDDMQEDLQGTRETVVPDNTTGDTSTDTTQLPTQTPDNSGSAIQPGNTGDAGCQHAYQQTSTIAATCTAVGSKKFTCGKCGVVTYEQIPMKAHSYQAATCLNPKTCIGCSRTEGTALGHSYGVDHLCTRCGVKDGEVSPESMPVDFVATIRSDEGVPISGVTVTIYTQASGSNRVGSGVTNEKGKTTIALSAGSSKYTLKLSNVPEGYQAQESYSFSVAQVTINLKTLPVRTDPNDHSKARYAEGDKMMDFTITDVDGRSYNLSQLRRENKLIILDFWYVSCNPCKAEFPYFEAALEAYGDDIVLLAVDPFYSADDIRQLRDEMGFSFPVFQDPLGLAEGFRVESYPTTVFIDSTGKIRKIHRSAFANEAAFLRAVAAYL